ncbi:Ig-like domain-containing protein [Clostridium sp. CX1]|uniref:Ig-like domain-containing protein n=1 Tax=Clostridium sp. CX1 TaxID=2978346 RepID=UPI0021C1F676|nr:Ig-like domain-containing protein [Clostridium sp. CX1]MCT8978549.1 Ig-like domain-containing protein [Clostridium sp. CX1]
MKRLLGSRFIAFLFISIFLFPINAKAQTASYTIGNVSNANVGAYVSFGGKTWRLLYNNYLILDEPAASMNYSHDNNSDYLVSDIRTYLNTTFFSSLGAERGCVKNTHWYMHSVNGDADVEFDDKICLSGAYEISILDEIHSNLSGSAWVLLKPVDNVKAYYYDLNSNQLKNQDSNQEGYIYAAICLNPEITVTGTGTSSDPYVVQVVRDTGSSGHGPSIRSIKLNLANNNLVAGSKTTIQPVAVYSNSSEKHLVNVKAYLADKDMLTGKSPYDIVVTGNEITYTSSNADIAEVDNNGNIIAKRAGTTKITVTCADFTSTMDITVIEKK